ncbi:expressed unknown protein [Ectocarpus siliculosus]|uniref:Uncharacterized protein n=1 Tax=Ectocarpus siliculosus TaxID=2880 RepID=D7FR17_ECTSI|nr:expressed unknown protein [Ectocarpus siliculosus]|eukprot:CBJ26171.1 expressed unknown protein [Ectocarpus siliculosus]
MRCLPSPFPPSCFRARNFWGSDRHVPGKFRLGIQLASARAAPPASGKATRRARLAASAVRRRWF